MLSVSGLVILSVVNWLHLVATVAWIGGIFTNLLVILPSAKESLEPPVMARFMGSFIKRLRRLIYVSMGVLVVTGVVMMPLNKQYAGTFDLGNLWTLLVVVKHIFVVILIILGVYLLQVLFSKIGRLAAKGPSPELAKLQKLQARLGITAFIVAMIILAFTAITGAISAMT